MKIVIFGLGSIGRRQARILQEHFSCDLVAFRSKGNKSLRNELRIPEVYSWDALKQLKADVAFITNPTSAHIPTALTCARLGMHLFIEKPLSHSLEGIGQLEMLCRNKRITCYVAYGLRFHPVIKKLRTLILNKKINHVRVVCSSHLASWRQGTDSKNSYSGLKAQGGGVLLDLSHEFDYIQYLFGDIKSICGKYGKAGMVTKDAEDFADVLLTTRQATFINLHLNFLSYLNERRIIIDHAKGCIIGDLMNNKIELLGPHSKKTLTFTATRDDYLKAQIQYFFRNLHKPGLMNNLKEAKTTLVKILEFKKNA